MHGSAGSNEFESGGGMMCAWNVDSAKMCNANEHCGCYMAWYRNCITLECFVGDRQGIWGHASGNQCVNGVEVLFGLSVNRTHGARLVCDEVHNISIPEASTAVKHRKKQEAIS